MAERPWKFESSRPHHCTWRAGRQRSAYPTGSPYFNDDAASGPTAVAAMCGAGRGWIEPSRTTERVGRHIQRSGPDPARSSRRRPRLALTLQRVAAVGDAFEQEEAVEIGSCGARRPCRSASTSSRSTPSNPSSPLFISAPSMSPPPTRPICDLGGNTGARDDDLERFLGDEHRVFEAGHIDADGHRHVGRQAADGDRARWRRSCAPPGGCRS